MDIDLPKKLKQALEKEASDAKISLSAHIIKKLEGITPPAEYIDKSVLVSGLPVLVDYLSKLPGVSIMSSKVTPDAYWWVKFHIDISNKLSWKVVQELGHVMNLICISEPLPTIFKPVSAPPYLNGGPEECLDWVIESTFNYIDPVWIKDTLEGRLPSPVENGSEWEA